MSHESDSGSRKMSDKKSVSHRTQRPASTRQQADVFSGSFKSVLLPSLSSLLVSAEKKNITFSILFVLAWRNSKDSLFIHEHVMQHTGCFRECHSELRPSYTCAEFSHKEQEWQCRRSWLLAPRLLPGQGTWLTSGGMGLQPNAFYSALRTDWQKLWW